MKFYSSILVVVLVTTGCSHPGGSQSKIIGPPEANSGFSNQEATFVVQDGKIEVRRGADGINIYINEHQVISLNAAKNSYDISIFGDKFPAVGIGFQEWQHQPEFMRRIVEINGNMTAIDYNVNGEIKAKNPLADAP